MIPYVRQRKIVEELEKKDIIYIDDLVGIFDEVSESTIRRDLKILEEEGQIQTLRGGGVKLKGSSYDIPVVEKESMYKEEKERIARFAASLVQNNEVIYIDSGTTCLQMLKYLKEKTLTIITSNIQVLSEIDSPTLTCIILGGEVNKALDSISGPLTETTLKSLYFDKAFLGTSGYSLENGVNTPDFKEANKKSLVKEKSNECYVLADHSKCDINTLCKAFELNECIFITDKSTKLLENHTKYYIAD
jgi:DeoR family fructose operon transcriptional repressor